VLCGQNFPRRGAYYRGVSKRARYTGRMGWSSAC
jgi:hypothetical protein